MPAGQPGPRDRATGMQLLATAFWAADARAMRDMARALGDRAADSTYATLCDNIRAAFPHAYVHPDGTAGQPVPATDSWPSRVMTSQTTYALALRNGLVPTALRASAAQHLVEAIAAHDGHLSTGLLATPNVLPARSESGRDDIAYDLLLTASVPSWLYSI
jgi:alpha-L-rhamnosidase